MQYISSGFLFLHNECIFELSVVRVEMCRSVVNIS